MTARTSLVPRPEVEMAREVLALIKAASPLDQVRNLLRPETYGAAVSLSAWNVIREVEILVDIAENGGTDQSRMAAVCLLRKHARDALTTTGQLAEITQREQHVEPDGTLVTKDARALTLVTDASLRASSVLDPTGDPSDAHGNQRQPESLPGQHQSPPTPPTGHDEPGDGPPGCGEGLPDLGDPGVDETDPQALSQSEALEAEIDQGVEGSPGYEQISGPEELAGHKPPSREVGSGICS